VTKPNKKQLTAAGRIAARYTKNCTAQVALLVPCYSSNMGPCSDCRRRSGLKREIAAALAEAEEQGRCDYPDTDNSPNEHPAYRRGDDHGFLVGIERAAKKLESQDAAKLNPVYAAALVRSLLPGEAT
jgi:hypothetical protein